MNDSTQQRDDFEEVRAKRPLPDVTFSEAFELQYGRDVLNFAATVHAMARNGDSTAIGEAIRAVSWIFAGAGEIIRTQQKSRLN